MYERSGLGSRVARIIFLGIWLVITIFPLYWIIVTSLKTPGAIYTRPIEYWPRAFSVDNYVNLFERASFSTYLLNSLLVSTVAATFATFSALFAAYVLARFHFRAKDLS